MAAEVTFLEQHAPIDEYGRACYAVARSVVRAMIDSLSAEDLMDLNTPLADVRLRQLAKLKRLERDKGMRGDGFEWAVHEAVLGNEPSVLEPLNTALRKASTSVLKDAKPTSLLFGYERARYLGFLDAVVDEAGIESYLLPEGSGRPFRFGPWVSVAAGGADAEPRLNDRIKRVWKTDLFLSMQDDPRYFAATVKSNFADLEGGPGLRIGIVPESADRGNRSSVRYDKNHRLWIVSLADPNGFMGMFSDAYHAVARAMCTLGKHDPPPYFVKPSAKATHVQLQLERWGDALATEVEAALNDAAQQNLIGQTHQLVSVNAPEWLHLKQMAPKVICPKPKFYKLD